MRGDEKVVALFMVTLFAFFFIASLGVKVLDHLNSREAAASYRECVKHHVPKECR